MLVVHSERAWAPALLWPHLAAWQDLSGIGDADFHAPEARGRRAVARPHGLLWLALAAILSSPQRPVIAVADAVAGVPELGGNAAVTRVLQHPRFLSVLDLPPQLASELEVVALVVDRPAPVRLHVDAVVGGADQFFEGAIAGQHADVGHADQRNAVPAFGAHGAVRTRVADRGRRFARRQVAAEHPVADDVGTLRRNAFVIEGERAESRPVFQTRVGNNVDDFRRVLQLVELVDRQEAHAGEVRLGAEHAVELDRVADRFVRLQ